ncbi:hypothetical protein J6590_038099 [Homalodisca vitripennis]|nr:hypothetical protein J6590_038099 [Homalodisca vitripennis]
MSTPRKKGKPALNQPLQSKQAGDDQLDRAFVVFRNACQDDGLLFTTRLHLLELVELRANQWSNSDNTLVYYSAKMAATDIEPFVTTPDANTTTPLPLPSPSSPIPPALGPGEVLKTSGKFPKPTKVPGKNYCKDEVVIRNADSGKGEIVFLSIYILLWST